MNLDRHGGGCRCLLRIRENMGNPMISDERFIEDHLDAYPDWRQTPGAASPDRLLALAVELGIASNGAILSDYDRILALHRAGNPVLIRSRRPATPGREPSEQVALLLQMDETSLSLWVPAWDGSDDLVRETRRLFWDATQASGIVLHTAVPALTSP